MPNENFDEFLSNLRREMRVAQEALSRYNNVASEEMRRAREALTERNNNVYYNTAPGINSTISDRSLSREWQRAFFNTPLIENNSPPSSPTTDNEQLFVFIKRFTHHCKNCIFIASRSDSALRPHDFYLCMLDARNPLIIGKWGNRDFELNYIYLSYVYDFVISKTISQIEDRTYQFYAEAVEVAMNQGLIS